MFGQSNSNHLLIVSFFKGDVAKNWQICPTLSFAMSMIRSSSNRPASTLQRPSGGRRRTTSASSSTTARLPAFTPSQRLSFNRPLISAAVFSPEMKLFRFVEKFWKKQCAIWSPITVNFWSVIDDNESQLL